MDKSSKRRNRANDVITDLPLIEGIFIESDCGGFAPEAKPVADEVGVIVGALVRKRLSPVSFRERFGDDRLGDVDSLGVGGWVQGDRGRARAVVGHDGRGQVAEVGLECRSSCYIRVFLRSHEQEEFPYRETVHRLRHGAWERRQWVLAKMELELKLLACL